MKITDKQFRIFLAMWFVFVAIICSAIVYAESIGALTTWQASVLIGCDFILFAFVPAVVIEYFMK